jgi:hypothetical protein
MCNHAPLRESLVMKSGAAGASVSTQNLLKPSLKAASKLGKWRLVPRWYKSGESRVKVCNKVRKETLELPHLGTKIRLQRG